MSVDLAKLRNLADAARAKSQQSRKTRDGRSWYRIENAVSDRAEVYLYDMIGEWGVTADDFVSELRALRTPHIELHLNCEGGEVFDGLAIYESLRQHPAEVTAYVDGIAASAASFVVQAADRRVMARNARLMIHDAHGLVVGNAADMREMADLLDDLSNNIADIYADRAGGTVASWRNAMRGPNGASDGTWYSAEAAVKAGLADEVAGRQDRTPQDRVDPAVLAVADVPPTQAPADTWNPRALLELLKGELR
jgi:ATP-dependent protease ClpP protease subunit